MNTSEKKNVTPVTEKEKTMTKYDLKMQHRKEEAAKAKRDEIKGTIIGIALVVALAAFVASFPIRSWLSVNGSYIKVGGKRCPRWSSHSTIIWRKAVIFSRWVLICP